MKRALPLVALLACALAHGAEQVWIQTPFKLEATLYRPAGDGPFPLIVFSHGSTGSGAIPASRTLRPDWLAPFALEHGFALLAPMRRGRGRSEGLYSEAYSCDPVRLDAGVRHAMDDLDAVLQYARALPFVDASRIVLAGASRGGIRRLSTPRSARASRACMTDFNSQAFAGAARRATTPMLWLYAENDSYYAGESARRYAAAFAEAGGKVELRIYPPVPGDGHFFYRRTRAWEKDLAEYLAALRLSGPRSPAPPVPPPARP